MPDAVRDAVRALEESGLLEPAEELRRRYAGVDVGALRSSVVDALGFDPLDASNHFQAQTLATNLDLYQRVLRRGTITIAELRALPSTTASRRELYATYDGILQHAGIDVGGTFLVNNFPVTRLAVGFARSGFAPTEADLVPYRGRAARGNAERVQLFAHPLETEALVFTLDRNRLERWLRNNGFLNERDLAGGSLSRWYARALESFDGQMPTWDPAALVGSERRAAAALYGLLHTMSHQLLRSVSIDSGFGEAALSEYLFPYDFAFAIFPNASSEFTIGGLRTVMEQELGAVVRRALDDDGCLYDPNCFETDGADLGCLLLPETSCIGWNRDLTRWYLFGGGPNQLTGYWEPALE